MPTTPRSARRGPARGAGVRRTSWRLVLLATSSAAVLAAGMTSATAAPAASPPAWAPGVTAADGWAQALAHPTVTPIGGWADDVKTASPSSGGSAPKAVTAAIKTASAGGAKAPVTFTPKAASTTGVGGAPTGSWHPSTGQGDVGTSTVKGASASSFPASKAAPAAVASR